MRTHLRDQASPAIWAQQVIHTLPCLALEHKGVVRPHFIQDGSVTLISVFATLNYAIVLPKRAPLSVFLSCIL